jgi:hypothetical protein
MAAYSVRRDPTAAGGAEGFAGSFVQWGAVLSGTVVGLAVVVLLNSLWFALAQASDITVVQDNLHWFAMGSALAGVFLGGLIAGWMTGIPGAGQGLVNGLTVWGLVLVGTFVVAVPGALQVIEFTALPLGEWGADALWATFWAITGGMVVAGLGGVIGGALPRPGWYGLIGRHDAQRYDWEDYRDPSLRHDGGRGTEGEWHEQERRLGERRRTDRRMHESEREPVVDLTADAERERYDEAARHQHTP